MCAGVEFGGKRIRWSDPDAQLPLLLKGGKVGWGMWGLPYQELVSKPLPRGGWARIESIRDGKWKRYKPVPVKIPATAFMERGKDGSEVWFPVAEGMVIQGAVIELPNLIFTHARGETILRVYVVTLPAIGEVAAVHDRMPRIVPRESRPEAA